MKISPLSPHFLFSAPTTIVKLSFTIVPFDNMNEPGACPAHLQHTGEDGTASIELVTGAFDLFEGATFECVSLCALVSSF